MKASTLFILALALFMGLGLVVAVKYSGILNPPEKKVEAPPPPPPLPQVVAAARNLYAGDSISPSDVRLRPITPEDAPAYAKNHAEFLPPVAESAYFRTVRKDVMAGQAIKLDLLEPMGKPEPLHDRLPPLTRAIDLQVEPENCAAGLIQVEDWVDVYLTTMVGRTDCTESHAQTALLARNVQVVAKRGTLYHTYAPLPRGPIQFTLAPNLYRAGLIDYARNKGVISLQPVSRAEKDKLDALKAEVTDDPEKVVALSLPPDADEFHEELQRVLTHSRGAAKAGDEDLLRIFHLTPPALPVAPVIVDYIAGTQRKGGTAFVPVDGVLQPYTGPQNAAAYTFAPPPTTPVEPHKQ